jgi:hypothetical protein
LQAALEIADEGKLNLLAAMISNALEEANKQLDLPGVRL